MNNEGAEVAQNKGLSIPRNNYNYNYDHIDRFELLFIFLVPIFSHLPVLQEGTTAKIPVLGSSHNCSLLLNGSF